jgi:predicted component of type VI protein secretion system
MPPHTTVCSECQPAPAENPSADTSVTIRNRPRLASALPSTIAEGNQPSLPAVEPPPPAPANGEHAATPSESQECRRLLAALESLSADKVPGPAPAPERRAPTTAVVAALAVPQPRLRVLRGQKLNLEYPVYEGPNLIGRRDDKPVDIDLTDQEAADCVWASRQHALVFYDNGILTIEDLHSLNGTFVNRHRVFPGQKRTLTANDVVQIGTIQLKVTF